MTLWRGRGETSQPDLVWESESSLRTSAAHTVGRKGMGKERGVSSSSHPLSSLGFSRRVLLPRRVTASRNGNHKREHVGRRE